MTDSELILEAFDSRAQRREERRAFFKAAAGLAAVSVGGLAFTSIADAQTVSDADILNFALNLEYLEAQFYSYAANGVGLASSLQTGTGTQGGLAAPSGSTPARKVAFTDPVVSAYAQEIAADEAAHVAFLRNALGSSAAVAQPQLNISGGAGSAFAAAATAAGLPGGSTFDPYSSDNNFLLGAFIFEDVGVTAYKGAAPLLANKTYLEAAAGIMAVEAYHAALIRTTLYERGVTLQNATESISNARDSLDGASDDDQGIAPVTYQGGTASNIAPVDSNGLAFGRTAASVLNIVYLNKSAVSLGGFFPAGVNGTIKTSTAN